MVWTAEYLAGRRRLEDVRSIEIEALVDTGATFPALPEDMVEKLGIPITGEGEAETAEGVARFRLASYLLIRVEDRTALTPAIIRPRGTAPILGVVALEQMGYRVDHVTGRLIKGLPLMI